MRSKIERDTSSPLFSFVHVPADSPTSCRREVFFMSRSRRSIHSFYSLCARQPSFRLLPFNIAYNIILDFILKSNSLMQKLKKKFQFLEPSLKDAGHLRSTGDALFLKGLFALRAAPMITVMASRRSEKRINIRLDRLYFLCFFFERRSRFFLPAIATTIFH